MMFHNTDNLYFGRLPDGKVRILKLPATPVEWPKADGVYPDALFDATIDSDSWGSIVASVSAKGEEGGRWYQAMDFHHGREGKSPTEDAGS